MSTGERRRTSQFRADAPSFRHRNRCAPISLRSECQKPSREVYQRSKGAIMAFSWRSQFCFLVSGHPNVRSTISDLIYRGAML